MTGVQTCALPIYFPIFVNKEQDVNVVIKNNNGVNMQRIMEVYKMSMDKDEQLNTYRVWNI